MRVPDVRPFPDGHEVNISLSKEFLVRNLILLPPLQCGVGAALIILDGGGRARHAQQRECERVDCLRASEQSVREAVDSFSPAGGVIVPVIGIWNSGYKSGTFISKTNFTIQGRACRALTRTSAQRPAGRSCWVLWVHPPVLVIYGAKSWHRRWSRYIHRSEAATTMCRPR